MKIHCQNPKHQDDTPSMHVYSEYAHCFSCGYRIPLSEVRDAQVKEEIKKKEPEKIEETHRYIKSLPKIKARGLEFHADNSGYYILWPPPSTFYKKRLFLGKSRYVGPRGHMAPLYKFENSAKDILVIVEGEINVISLQSIPEVPRPGLQLVSFCSPGSATQLGQYLDYYLRYSNIFIIVDKDKPGVINGLKLKNTLLKHGKKVTLHATEKDCNQILQDEGPEGLRKWCKDVGVPLWV